MGETEINRKAPFMQTATQMKLGYTMLSEMSDLEGYILLDSISVTFCESWNLWLSRDEI